MTFSKNILNTAVTLVIVLMASVTSMAQSAPDAVYYVCAEQGFKLTVDSGYDHYQWTEDSIGVQGADSNKMVVPAMGANVVGDSFKVKTYQVRAMNTNACWTEPKTFLVYILPKMTLTVAGYTPPYCEHLSHDIPLIARVNGDTGSAALNLPIGVGVKYSWTVEPAVVQNNYWNGEIIGATNLSQAQVVTPQTTSSDNVYNVTAEYTYPATTNIGTDVLGNCNASFTQTVHADPAPPVPQINYESI